MMDECWMAVWPLRVLFFPSTILLCGECCCCALPRSYATRRRLWVTAAEHAALGSPLKRMLMTDTRQASKRRQLLRVWFVAPGGQNPSLAPHALRTASDAESCWFIHTSPHPVHAPSPGPRPAQRWRWGW